MPPFDGDHRRDDLHRVRGRRLERVKVAIDARMDVTAEDDRSAALVLANHRPDLAEQKTNSSGPRVDDRLRSPLMRRVAVGVEEGDDDAPRPVCRARRAIALRTPARRAAVCSLPSARASVMPKMRSRESSCSGREQVTGCTSRAGVDGPTR